MAQKKLKIATGDEILHELTKIALGTRYFEAREKGSDEPVDTPPSEGATMKALELLGKSQQLFSEKQNLAESVQVEISVIEPEN